jgi:hypothetical protein
MLVQLPIVLYQRFVVMPRRTGAAPFDAIVGAFGGDPMGGGASNTMGLFCVVGIIIVVSRWRSGLMRGGFAILLSSAGFICIALAEIKFMVLLLPVAFAALYRKDILRRPLQSFVMIFISTVLAAGVLFAYKTQYDSLRRQQTISEYFERMFRGNTDADFVNMQTGQIGRVASVVFWYREHSIGDPASMLLGHGSGSSRVGGMVVGEAAKNYAFQITRSAIGILLWEVGLIGTLAYLSMLVAGYRVLDRKSVNLDYTAEERSTFASMSVAMVVFLASIPYSTDMMSAHQMQILLMLCLGFATIRPRSADRSLSYSPVGTERNPASHRSVRAST